MRSLFFVLAFVVGLNPAFAQETQKGDPSAKAWQIIDQAMAGNVDQRRLIVEAASLGGARPKVYEYLGRAVKDKDEEVRMAACGSLASLKDSRSIEPLKTLLMDPNEGITFCAAQALFNLDDPAGEEALLEVISGGTKTGKGYISAEKQKAMAGFKTRKRVFATLFRLGVKFAPVPGLGMGVTSLQALLADNQAPGKALVALAFAKGTDSETLQALRDALGDKNPIVRAAAIHSLALRNDPSVRNDLIPLMDDKDDRVRYRAAVAYLRLTKVEEEMKSQAESQVAQKESTPSKSKKKK